MLSTINGLDLFLVFTIIGVIYYASIQSDNADIATAKLETMRLASVQDSRELNSLTAEVYILEERVSLFTDFLDRTNQWQELHHFAEQDEVVFDYNADPWSAPPQTSEKPSQADLDEWANLI